MNNIELKFVFDLEKLLLTWIDLLYSTRIQVDHEYAPHRLRFIKIHGKTFIWPQHCHPDTRSYPPITLFFLSEHFDGHNHRVTWVCFLFPRLLSRDWCLSAVFMFKCNNCLLRFSLNCWEILEHTLLCINTT